MAAKEDPNGTWHVRWVGGKPVQAGFSPLAGDGVKRYTDSDGEILRQIHAGREEKKAASQETRRTAISKVATFAGLTPEETKELFR